MSSLFHSKTLDLFKTLPVAMIRSYFFSASFSILSLIFIPSLGHGLVVGCVLNDNKAGLLSFPPTISSFFGQGFGSTSYGAKALGADASLFGYSVVRMPFGAMCFPDVLRGKRYSPVTVYFGSDRLQVFWITARPVTAEVIDFESSSLKLVTVSVPPGFDAMPWGRNAPAPNTSLPPRNWKIW